MVNLHSEDVGFRDMKLLKRSRNESFRAFVIRIKKILVRLVFLRRLVKGKAGPAQVHRAVHGLVLPIWSLTIPIASSARVVSGQ